MRVPHSGLHRSFAVDSNTNRLQSATTCTDLSCDPTLGPPTVESLSYNANGNVVQDEQHTFQMDAMNRVLKVRDRSSGSEVGEFRYDAAGRRVMKRSENSGLTTFYIRDREGQVLSEFSRPTSSAALPLWRGDYVYVAGRVVARTERDKPDPPAGLYVEQITGCPPELGPITVKLAWQRSPESDVAGYQVIRNSVLISLTDVPVETPTFPDLPLIGVTYNYQLKAKDPLYSSDLSPDYWASFCLSVDPDPPGTLEASAGDSHVSLTWFTANTSSPNAVIGYEVYRGLAVSGTCPGPESGYALQNSLPITGTGYVDATVENGTTHCYYVKARDTAAEISGPSNVVSATPLDVDPPAPPRNLRAHTGCAGGKVSLQWDANAESDSVLEYHLYRSTSADMAGADRITYPETISFPVTDDPLPEESPAGQIYYYAVAAADTSNLESPRSPVLAVYLRVVEEVVAAPTNLVATAASSQVILNWEHSVYTHFKVYRRPLGGTCADFQVILNDTFPIRPFSTIDYLAVNFDAYEYAISAVATIGDQERESFDSFVAGPVVPLEGPAGVRVCYTPKFYDGFFYWNELAFTWPQVGLADRLYDPVEAAEQGRGYVAFVGYTTATREDVTRFSYYSGPSGAAFTQWNNKLIRDAVFWQTLSLRAVYRINDFK